METLKFRGQTTSQSAPSSASALLSYKTVETTYRGRTYLRQVPVYQAAVSASTPDFERVSRDIAWKQVEQSRVCSVVTFKTTFEVDGETYTVFSTPSGKHLLAQGSHQAKSKEVMCKTLFDSVALGDLDFDGVAQPLKFQ